MLNTTLLVKCVRW